MAPSKTGLVSISAEVEEQLRDEVREHAIANDRSFSAEVRRALRIYMLSEKSVAGTAA